MNFTIKTTEINPIVNCCEGVTVELITSEFSFNLVGGITDHGLLSGLLDDDHTQYFNQARLEEELAEVAFTGSYNDLIDKPITPDAPVWGSIIGTLSSQTDLQEALDDKVPYTGATDDVELGEFGISGGNAAFKSLNINGVNGNGHIHLKHQASTPSSTGSSSTLFADNDGNISWLNDGLDKITLDTNGVTDARVYTYQDKSYTLADNADLAGKQDTLVSGSNIKTINSNSLLGSGNISISANSVLDKSVTQQDIVNTVAETNVVSYTIPANTLGTNAILKIKVGGYFLNNSASVTNATFRLRIKYGSQTLYNDITTTQSISSNLAPFFMEVLLFANGATNLQKLNGFASVSSINAATSGSGDIGTDEILVNSPIRGASTTDSTNNNDFVISVELGKADANLQFTKDYHLIEIM